VNGIMCVRGDRGAGGSPRHGRRLPRLPGVTSVKALCLVLVISDNA
jgi:hypothetical protein